MKTVLAYGDSLTWGYDPVNLGRHAYEVRWTSVLQKALGHGVRVIAEGLNGRTTAYDDHLGDCERNGTKLLPTLLATHKPIDLVIIMLGTNDLKRGIQGTAIGATSGVKRLVKLVQKHDWGFEFDEPEILVVAPPAIARRPIRCLAPCSTTRWTKAPCSPACTAMRQTNRDAPSSTQDRSQRPRRSTASISMLKTPVRSVAVLSLSSA